MARKVVITGVGAVSPFGVGLNPLWEGLVAGKSALGPIGRVNLAGFRSRLAGEIKDFSARDYVPKAYRKAVKVMARDTEIAVVAAKLAVEDAGLVTRVHADSGQTQTTYPPERMGCQIGAGLIAAETLEMSMAMATAVPANPTPESLARSEGFDLRAWGTEGENPGNGGMNNLQPLWMLKYLPNMLACHVTILHGGEGPSNTITCSEASGLLCIGEGSRVIERNGADLTFSGGAESKMNLMGVLRCDFAGRLAATGDATDGGTVVRPYDPDSPGTLLGEGGGMVILEEAAGAAKRGATVYAEVAGFGAGHSGPPMIPPLPTPGPDAHNLGLENAVRAALRDAGVGPESIDAIVPQGLGVPAVDALELGALRRVFGERLRTVPLVTLTPYVGDFVAGHGAFQLAVAAKCVREQRLPARLHSGAPASDALAGAAPSTPADLGHVLVCTGSMCGQSAAVVLRRAS